MRFLLLAGLLTAISASPLDVERREPSSTGSFCSAVTSIVTKAKAEKPATKFCSSYLGIKTSTITSTKSLTATITSTLTSTTSTNTITTTKTSTSTVTTTTLSLSNCIDNAAKAKRGETPVAKPSCFSSYAGSVLSSACECLSIPTPTATVIRSTTVATTTTAKTVNVVAKTTTTVKAIKTATATVGSPNFYIQASGGNVDGEYAILPRSGENIIVEFTSLDPGTLFTLDDSCHLVVAAGNSTGKIANEDGVSSYGFVFISSEDLIEQFDYVYVTCSVDAGTDRLVCSVPSGSGDSVNDNGWQVGPDSPDTPITVTAIAG